ncbi:MAG: DUF4286 family protein [Phycisphaeraceae bacterium]|nr:DUF4286 family protein [Phycisphaeraceae bacterium]MBX3368461.1 DUF4286 family protein [Phycisphaeraceae bacterium]
MQQVEYAVTASIPNKALCDRYLRWLTGGHVQAVVASGATRARLLVIEPDTPGDEETHTVRSVYEFPTRADYQHYLQAHAPALRADGLAHFGPETGITFRREIASIHFVYER